MSYILSWIFISSLVLLELRTHILALQSEEKQQTGANSVTLILNDAAYADHTEDSIFITSPPKSIPISQPLTIRYTCSKRRVVGVDVVASVNAITSVRQIYRRSWRCDKTFGEDVTKQVIVNLRDKYVYKPSYLNRDAVLIEKVKIRAWIIDLELWPRVLSDPYKYGTASTWFKLQVSDLYNRPEKPSSECEPWSYKVQKMRKFWHLLVCPLQPEVIRTIQYPVIITGRRHGIFRKFPVFTEPELHEKSNDVTNPVFTLSIWLYIKDYCLDIASHPLCSIVHHLEWNDAYLSPLLFINPQGVLHFQTTSTKMQFQANLTPWPVPKEEWFRIVISLKNKKWIIALHYGPDRNYQKHLRTEWQFNDDVYLNDTTGLFVFGGSDMVMGFKGYIGQATWYRGKYLDPDDIPFPHRYHPMFELGVRQRHDRCHNYLRYVRLRISHNKEQLEKHIEATSCLWRYKSVMMHGRSSVTSRVLPQCPLFRRVSSYYRMVNRVLRENIFTGREPVLSKIGEVIFENATAIVETEGIKSTKTIVPLLKQASCYGNLDAMYMLSVILNQGIGVKSDEITALAYVMYAALAENRFSLMALGNKHINGLDGLPLDNEIAFSYFKAMADITKSDRDLHQGQDVFTEHVRLTNEWQMNEQTDEDGDLVQWIKHQAKQGVLTAQRQLGAMYYWGAQGIRRNVNAAAEYYRMGAEQQDPQALFEYGLVLMKGQGVKKNMNAGMQHLKKSAELKNPQALNTLGWHAHHNEGNWTKAAQYYDRAYALGSPDAAYNLAYMYFSGQYPGVGIDRLKAFELYQFAAVRNQFESGIMIGYFNIRGLPNKRRDTRFAADWARYVSELNPKVGLLLRKALTAYRHQEWEKSIFYYIMAAETGLEVANFNLGYIAENNNDGILSYIEKDCIWRPFNISTQRHLHQVDAYSLIKMGDYYWYGHHGPRNITLAAEKYGAAAVKGEPHALFNLATMVEEGAKVPTDVWYSLRIPYRVQQKHTMLLMTLYSRCKESTQSEAYVPCRLALFKVQMQDLWAQYQTVVKLSTALGVTVVSGVALSGIYARFRRRLPDSANV